MIALTVDLGVVGTDLRHSAQERLLLRSREPGSPGVFLALVAMTAVELLGAVAGLTDGELSLWC